MLTHILAQEKETEQKPKERDTIFMTFRHHQNSRTGSGWTLEPGAEEMMPCWWPTVSYITASYSALAFCPLDTNSIP